ncbi:hypothetical protein TNCV_4356951 [Trichonephila clavipes]|nr:hypothetical protein TNCV_4356951 [Trichonephila clavipes]
MGFRSERPTHVPLLTAWHKVLRPMPVSINTDVGRLITGSMFPVINHVSWSDESRFQLNRADGRVRKALQNSGCQLSPTLLQSLIESIPRPFAALLHACGGLTLYYADAPVFLALQCIFSSST